MTVDKTPFNLERLQREVNILLISDLHYDIKRQEGKGNERQGAYVNDCLVNSLLNLNKPENDPESEWEPDIIVVAGDLVNHNKTDNYTLYEDLIEKLTRSFPNLKNTYFSTPGNHDVNRENMVAAFPYLYHLAKLNPDMKATVSFTNNPVVDTILTVAATSINDVPVLGEELAKFEKEYFKTYLAQQKKLSDKGIIYTPEVTSLFKDIETLYHKSILGINLLSVNSSFFCNLSQAGHDRNHLFLIRGLVEEVNKKLKQSICGPIISFMHHPFYFLHDTEHIAPVTSADEEDEIDKANEQHYDTQKNNFTKLIERSDMVLSGHMHGELHDPTSLQHHAYLVTNGTSYTTDDFESKCYPFTYAIIKINKQLGKFCMRKFKYKKKDDMYTFTAPKEQARKYYPFFSRKNTEPTSVESEKVRVLHYFKTLYLKTRSYPEWHFFVFQLRLFCKDMEIESIQYDYKKGSGSMDDQENITADEIKYKTVKKDKNEKDYEECKTIWIYRMHKDAFLLRNIKKIISSNTDSRQNRTIYFSIDMNSLFDNDTLKYEEIEKLRQDFQEYVLIIKNEKINLNLLYH